MGGHGKEPPVSALKQTLRGTGKSVPSEALCTRLELTFTFVFYAVSIAQPSQFLREIVFDLRMSKSAWCVFAQVHAAQLPDSALDTVTGTPRVDGRRY